MKQEGGVFKGPVSVRLTVKAGDNTYVFVGHVSDEVGTKLSLDFIRTVHPAKPVKP